MVIAVAPVVERDPDLQDAVIEPAVGCTRGTPQQLERLVLFEELAAVELLDSFAQCRRRRLVTASADRLVDLPTRDALRRARRLALATTRRAASR